MRASGIMAAGLCLALAGACAGPTATGGVDPAAIGASVLAADPDAVTTLARDFETVAFRSVDAGVATSRRFARMAPPVVVNVAPSSVTGSRQETAIVAGAVGSLLGGAGIDIALTEVSMFTLLDAGRARSAFLVTFVEPGAIPSLREQLLGTGVAASLVEALTSTLTGSGCAGLEFNRGGGPDIILINVSTGRGADRQSSCVHREIAANLGLPGMLDRPGSVFSTSATVADYTARDLVLLRMLYDPRLRDGMSAAEARPLLPAVAAEALAR